MINSIHVTLAKRAAASADPTILPTFMFFSTEPEDDVSLLKRFVPAIYGEKSGDTISLIWYLPDPDIKLGQVNFSRDDAIRYQDCNEAAGIVQLLIVHDAPEATEQRYLELSRFYIDWTGILGSFDLSDPQFPRSPISGLKQRYAHLLRNANRLTAAAQALLDELALARQDGDTFSPHAAHALHEAALLAEAGGIEDAMEYFETVALTVYSNHHDALLGLAMLAKENFEQVVPLLGRAYAVRRQENELRLFARAFAQSTGQSQRTIYKAVRDYSGSVNLDEPLFHDPSGVPLHISAGEVLAHIDALKSSLAAP